MSKQFPIDEHVNYVHLVGVIKDCEFVDREGDQSNYMTMNILVKTKFKDKEHPEVVVPVIFWDKLANALETKHRIAQGDQINIEGRLTSYKGAWCVTGNKAQLVVKDKKTGKLTLVPVQK